MFHYYMKADIYELEELFIKTDILLTWNSENVTANDDIIKITQKYCTRMIEMNIKSIYCLYISK